MGEYGERSLLLLICLLSTLPKGESFHNIAIQKFIWCQIYVCMFYIYFFLIFSAHAFIILMQISYSYIQHIFIKFLSNSSETTLFKEEQTPLHIYKLDNVHYQYIMYDVFGIIKSPHVISMFHQRIINIFLIKSKVRILFILLIILLFLS